MRHAALLATLTFTLTATPTLALPPAGLNVEGALAAQGGGPVADGSYPLTFRLYDGEASGAKQLWEEIQVAVAVKGGTFATVLGGKVALPLKEFGDGSAAWIGVTVGGEPELARVGLRAVPYALRAGSAGVAGDLQCSGCVEAGDLAAGSVTADKLAEGAVQTKHVGFTYAGSDSKGGSATHAITADAAKAAEVAKNAENAAKADEAKSALAAQKADEAKKALVADKLQCTGCVSAAMLDDKAVADLVAAKKLAPIAVSGAAKDLTGALAADLDFATNQALLFRVQNSKTEPAKCDAKTTGMVWFDTAAAQFMGCNGNAWNPLGGNKALGTVTNPAASCAQVLAADSAAKTGIYWIQTPAAPGPFQAYCDMDTAGGGWMLLLTLTHPRDQYAGSVNPFLYDLNAGSPSLKTGYGRDWSRDLGNGAMLNGVTEFLIRRPNAGGNPAVTATVKQWCNWKGTGGTCGTNTGHGFLAFIDPPPGKNGAWYFNQCSLDGGCNSSGTDGPGFNTYPDHCNGPNSAFGACWTGSTGTMYWDGQTVGDTEVLTYWIRQPVLPANAPATCQQALQAGGKTGVTWLDFDGPGPAQPFKAYCDQATGGGGWMLLATILHPQDQYPGSVNPFVVPLNMGAPAPDKAYSRNWLATVGDAAVVNGKTEFLIAHESNNPRQTIQATVGAWCGWDKTGAQCGTSSNHGYYAKIQTPQGKGGSWYFNACNKDGGCLSSGTDGPGFGVNGSWCHGPDQGHGVCWTGSDGNFYWAGNALGKSQVMTYWMR